MNGAWLDAAPAFLVVASLFMVPGQAVLLSHIYPVSVTTCALINLSSGLDHESLNDVVTSGHHVLVDFEGANARLRDRRVLTRVSGNSIAIAYDCLFPYTTGGGERLYRSYAEWLHRRGRSVDYLTAVQWDGAPRQPTGFRIVPISKRLRLYDDSGVRRTPAALAFAWNLFRSLRRRRGEYDAVIASGLPVLNVFAARAALVGCGTRLVVDYLEVWGYRQWIEYAGRGAGAVAWLLQRLAIALTPIATCHSQLTARRLRAEGFRGPLLVSPGLIDGESSNAFIPAHRVPPTRSTRAATFPTSRSK